MYDSNKGISQLAGVLQNRMQGVNGMNPLALDFGLINGDYSLKCNNFAKPIPRSDYSVCEKLTLGPAGGHLTETLSDGKHDGHTGGDGSHAHTIKIPPKLRSIGPGDRVLVAWIQNEAVVVDRVTKI